MENNFENIPTRNITEKLNFDSEGIGHWGFVIPDTEKYKDTVFYMPPIKGSSENGIHHATILKYILMKLFKEEVKTNFNNFKNSATFADGNIYLDSDEIAYSSFMASLESIVFLNTSENLFSSGMLFVPEEVETLNENLKFKEILEFLYEGKDLTSQIVIIPTLKDILENNKPIRAFDLEEYQEYVINKMNKTK